MKRIFEFLKKKNNRVKSILLTVVALIEVIALIGVATYCWVESVSSIKIYTTQGTYDDKGNLIENGTKGIINNPLFQRANVADGLEGEIDLTEYFRKSGDCHFTGASSADGNNIFFPEAKNDNSATSNNFRQGTISDKNVNYLSFTFKITNANDFAFSSVPEVKLGDTVVDDNLVRFSIGINGDFNVYGMTPASEDVVNSTSGDDGPTVVRAFKDYCSGGKRAFSTTGNSTYVTINMWIQDPAFAESSRYNNKTLTVSNFKIVPVKVFTAYAVYVEETVKTAGGKGGTVAINDGDFGAEATAYVAKGSKITLKATPNTTNGYDLLGWAESLSGNLVKTKAECIKTETIYSFEYTVNNLDAYYAQFTDEHTLYFKPQYVHESTVVYAAYIWGNQNGQLVHKWYQNPVNDGTKGYRFTYKGNASSVIFCYMDPASANVDLNTTDGDPWNYRWLQTYDLTFPLDVGEYTYISKARRAPYDDNNYLYGYWEHSYATVNIAKSEVVTDAGNIISQYMNDAYTNSAGTTRYSGNTLIMDGELYNQGSYPYEAKVTLNATVDSKYTFGGWYDNAACTGTPVSVLTSATVTAPANGSSITYYAKFDRKPDQWYLKGSFNSWGETNQFTLSSGTTYTASVELTPGDYEFKLYNKLTDKWYSNNWNYHNDYLGEANGDELPEQSDSNKNMKLNVTQRSTYTFTFDSDSKRMKISRTPIPTIKLTVNTQTDYGTMTNPGNKVKFNGGTATATNVSKVFSYGDSVAVTASVTNPSYYSFDGWYLSGTKVSSSATATFTANEDCEYVAKFTQKTKTYYFENTQSWSGTICVYAFSGSDNNKAWPGLAADNAGNNSGKVLYSKPIWAKHDTIIVNNNDKQTVDISLSDLGGDNALWISDQTTDGKYKMGGHWIK